VTTNTELNAIAAAAIIAGEQHRAQAQAAHDAQVMPSIASSTSANCMRTNIPLGGMARDQAGGTT
jgi:hypothetical protein